MTNFCDFDIIGNLTKDPESSFTPGGLCITKFTVACSIYRKDRDGNSVEETSYIQITTFGGQAENDKKYLRRGAKVAVKGTIKSWYDAEKNKGGYNFEAEGVLYLSSKPANAGGGEGQGERSQGDDRPAGNSEERRPRGGRARQGR